MAAPTTAARVKKALANPEPSTHGPSRRSLPCRQTDAIGGLRTCRRLAQSDAIDPKATFTACRRHGVCPLPLRGKGIRSWERRISEGLEHRLAWGGQQA